MVWKETFCMRGSKLDWRIVGSCDGTKGEMYRRLYSVIEERHKVTVLTCSMLK